MARGRNEVPALHSPPGLRLHLRLLSLVHDAIIVVLHGYIIVLNMGEYYF